MALEHQVWVKLEGKKCSSMMASYSLENWQWAEKFAQFLRDKGCDGVEVKLVEEEEDEEDE